MKPTKQTEGKEISRMKDPVKISIADLRPSGLTDIEIDVFRKIFEAIAERRLAPGIKLVEEELATIFDVSREKIRRILLVLSQHGIVRIEANRGASIAVPSAMERRDAFEARQLIERHVVQVLAGGKDLQRKAVVKDLREHLKQEQAAIVSQDRTLQIRLSGDFHLKLAAHAGNLQMLRMLQDVMMRMSLALVTQRHPNDLDCSINEHGQLLDAIEKGDAARAQASLEHHLAHLEQDMSESAAKSSALHQALMPHAH